MTAWRNTTTEPQPFHAASRDACRATSGLEALLGSFFGERAIRRYCRNLRLFQNFPRSFATPKKFARFLAEESDQ